MHLLLYTTTAIAKCTVHDCTKNWQLENSHNNHTNDTRSHNYYEARLQALRRKTQRRQQLVKLQRSRKTTRKSVSHLYKKTYHVTLHRNTVKSKQYFQTASSDQYDKSPFTPFARSKRALQNKIFSTFA